MKFKKLLSILMVVVLMLSVVSFNGINASASELKNDGTYYYKIENGEVSITGVVGNKIFFNNGNLPNTIGGYPVTSIGPSAFSETCIQNLVIPKGVKTISESAFFRISNLIKVVIPESVTNIDEYAFDLCGLVEVVHYNGTEEQWAQVQIGEGNEALEKVHCNEYVTAATCENVEVCAYEGCIHKGKELGHKGGSATCKEFAVCELCGRSYGQKAEHVYDNLKKDENSHWNECDCGKHEFDYTFGHGYSRVYDETEHWLECYCGAQTDFESHDFTEVRFDDNSHWTKCLCGVVNNDKSKHVYDNACDSTCNVCKKTRSVSSHSYKTTKTTKATLSKSGKIVKKCSRCGSSTTTTIRYPKTIKLSATSYTYNGKVKKPTVSVKDSAGKTISTSNYTVTYASGRKNVGKYKVTVKFKGNYSGTKYLYFTINPVKTTVKSLTAGKKSLKVAITKKSTQVTGYQIQYATNKSFKSAKTKTISYKTTSTTLKSLSAKKTYYVRVRTYKTVNGKKYYSGWSTMKYKKTK